MKRITPRQARLVYAFLAAVSGLFAALLVATEFTASKSSAYLLGAIGFILISIGSVMLRHVYDDSRGERRSSKTFPLTTLYSGVLVEVIASVLHRLHH